MIKGASKEEMVLPIDLPESDHVILFRNGKCTVVSSFIYLFKKYIESGNALFEINIASNVRNNITILMKQKYYDVNYTNNDNNGAIFEELIPLFEKCKVEITALLQGSYSRFKHTPEFNKLLDEVIETLE